MASALPILVLGALGVAALALGGSSSSGGASKPGGLQSVSSGPSIYDPGMPQSTQDAVTNALNTETDPRKLRAFAQSLAGGTPPFPIAAGLLNAKAAKIEAQQALPTTPVAPSTPLPTVQNPMGPGVLVDLPANPPGVFPSAGSQAIVATQSTPLNLRDQPSTSGNVIGSLAKGSAVNIIGGPVQGPGSDSGWSQVQQGSLTGWAALDFLKDAGGSSALADIAAALGSLTPVSAVPGAVSSGFPMQATVTTQSTPLNVRSGPSTTAAVVGSAAKGSTILVTGPSVPGDNSQAPTGWCPVQLADGTPGFASGKFLTPKLPETLITAGAPLGNTNVVPDAELLDWATRVEGAMQTGTCRSYSEPVVSRFQRAAKDRGIYFGNPHGFYDAPTAKALSIVLGKPVPPCVAAQGGPVDSAHYWNAPQAA